MRRRRNGGERSRRGSILVPVVIAVFSMVVLTSVLIGISGSSRARLNAEIEGKRARLMAEAGLSEAATALRAGASGNVGTLERPASIQGGLFWVQATEIDATRTRLVSMGMAGGGRSALEMVVERDWVLDGSIFDSVLNARGRLNLTADCMIDSYDSRLGSYESQAVHTTNGHTHANRSGPVRSNRDIVMSPRASVFGDAEPGPGYAVSLGPGAYVSGSTTPAAEPFELPPIEVPSYPSSGAYAVPATESTALPAGNYAFDTLSIEREGTLAITGPATLVVGEFEGGSDANLVIDATAGPVTIFCEGRYSHNQGFEATAAPGSPMAVAFLCTSDERVTFPSNTAIRGAYYVPNASMTFSANSEAWGSFVGDRIVMSSSMKFHYDEALADYWEEQVGNPGDQLQLVGWHETAIEPAFLARDRRDPFVVLDLDPASLPRPVDAWGE